MTNLPLFESEKKIENAFCPDAEIVLFQGEVSELVSSMPDNSVRLIITSPPYNLGKEYESRISIK
jgi:DNA modification methylase